MDDLRAAKLVRYYDIKSGTAHSRATLIDSYSKGNCRIFSFKSQNLIQTIENTGEPCCFSWPELNNCLSVAKSSTFLLRLYSHKNPLFKQFFYRCNRYFC